MRTTRFITATALAFALTATPALAEGPPLEEGATFFGDGYCVEADGATGFAAADGQCVTAADYDEMFSVAALEEVELHNGGGVSVAEAYGLVDDEVAPSDRELGEGLVEVTFTVNDLLGLHPAWAYETVDGHIVF